MKIDTITTIESTHTVKLRADEVIALLQKAGLKVSETAIVTVHVPGGGDWSNTNLYINSETPIEVTWTTTRSEP